MSKTALITGASRGIGRETAKRLLLSPEVSTIVVAARPSSAYEATLEELRSEAEQLGKQVVDLTVDVGDRSALQEALKPLGERVGNIDILVNNAGYTNPVPVHQIEFEDFERTMSVNLYGPFTLIQDLLHQGNSFDLIVNIASTAGIKGRSGWLTYSASKAALINMSDVLREELAIFGTRVVSISPGRTATDLRKVLAPDEDPATIMQPDSVAEVIGMLASPVGQYIDSENLVVRQ